MMGSGEDERQERILVGVIADVVEVKVVAVEGGENVPTRRWTRTRGGGKSLGVGTPLRKQRKKVRVWWGLFDTAS
jgi:hypothetical protein